MHQPDQPLPKERAGQVCRNLGKLAARLNITQQAIADATGYHRPNIARLFSGRFVPGLDVIFAVLQVINELADKHYTINDLDAPELPAPPPATPSSVN